MKYNKGMILAMGRNGATMALDIISKVAKQARLYQKMAEYSCNGEGILHGRKITTAIGTEAHPADKFYTDKGYSTAYANIYRTEAISSEKVHLDKDNVVFFGKVSLKNNESNSIKLTFTDGSFPLDTKIDMYNRYAIKVIPNALDSITVVDKNGKELGKRKFNPLNSIFEYNLP